MEATWLYCPRSCRWARVLRIGGLYLAQCDGDARWCRDELEAIGWAERMLGRVPQGKAG